MGREVTAEHVGTLLWEMRTATGLTLGHLAKRSGISKSSLSRWEAGLYQPRVTELEAVLDALDASPAQRALALACITAPRALRQLRQPSSSDTFGAPLSAGDLLRAMRLRVGWTQAQVSERLGVTRSTLTRWELGERLPTTDQIQALCYALDAREEEMIALTCGQFRDAPPSVEEADWDETAANLMERLEIVSNNLVGGLEDLHYIQLDREVWQWSVREPAARLLLARLRLYHGHYHRLNEHWEVSSVQVQQAHQSLLTVPTPERETENFVSPRLAILQAVIAVYGGARPAPERGIRMLSPWVDHRHVSPMHQAWILSDIAKYLSLAGNHEEALVLAERACHVVEQEAIPGELFLRRCDYGQILIHAGRAEEALQVLPHPLSYVPNDNNGVDAVLTYVEALVRVGQFSEAQDLLARASVPIETHALEPQRRKAQALAQRL